MLFIKFGDSQPLFLEIFFLPLSFLSSGAPSVCVCVGVSDGAHRFLGLCPFSFVSVLPVLGRTLCCVHLVSVVSWLKVDGFFCLRKWLLSPSGGFFILVIVLFNIRISHYNFSLFIDILYLVRAYPQTFLKLFRHSFFSFCLLDLLKVFVYKVPCGLPWGQFLFASFFREWVILYCVLARLTLLFLLRMGSMNIITWSH